MGTQSSKEVVKAPVVVIVGGGYGGATLAKTLDKNANFNVVLVDRKDHMVHNMASVRSVTEPGFEKEILIPYLNLLKYGSVVHGEVTEITDTQLTIHGHPEPVSFDYLVIATGSSYAFPGKLAEPTVADAIAKYKASQEELSKASKITIIGGGPVGVELAGEIATDHPTKSVTLIHSRSLLCSGPGLNETFSNRIQEQLEGLNVKILLEDRVELDMKGPNVYMAGKQVLETKKGAKIETDLAFFCTGLTLNNASLGHFNGIMNNGRLEVDEFLRVQGQKNIFAIGDISNKNESQGYYAMQQGKWLGNYFEKNIRQGKSVKPYPPQKIARITSIGRKGGVAQLPLTSKGKVFGSTVAGMIKSKDMFTSDQWNLLNIDRKTKTAKKPAQQASVDNQIVSLAAAMSITEDSAAMIKDGKLPVLEERANASFHS